MSNHLGDIARHLLAAAGALRTDKDLREQLHMLKRMNLGDTTSPLPARLPDITARLYAVGTSATISMAASLSQRSEGDHAVVGGAELDKALQEAGDTFQEVAWHIDNTEVGQAVCRQIRTRAAVCYALGGYVANARVAVEQLTLPDSIEISPESILEEPDRMLVLVLQERFAEIADRAGVIIREKDALARRLLAGNPLEGDVAKFLAAISIVTGCRAFTAYLFGGEHRQRKHADEMLHQAGRLYLAVRDIEGLDVVTELQGLFCVIGSRSVWNAVAPYLKASEYADYLQLLAKSIPVVWPSQAQILGQGLLDTTIQRLLFRLPTSGGKTLLAEWCIAQTLIGNPDSTCIYLTPTLALASQVEEDLNERLGSRGLGYGVAAVTGAFDITRLDEIRAANCRVLISTPEKLDSLTRRPPDRLLPVLQKPALILVDECHLVGQERRGVQLELLIIRLRHRYPGARIVGLSAVLDNPKDVSHWFNQDVRAEARGKDDIESNWRPTRIHGAVLSGDTLHYYEREDSGQVKDQYSVETHLQGLGTKEKKAAWLALHYAQIPHIRNVMVFSNSVPRCRELALEVEQLLKPDDSFPYDLLVSESQKQAWEKNLKRLQALLEATQDSLYIPDLPRLASKGISIHHASLSPEAKSIIEEFLRLGYIRIVVATATLAEGVNLPVGCVVAPYLTFFDKDLGRAKPIPYSTFRNVAGRAGRAKYHTAGHVVVLSDDVKYLDPRVTEPTKSQLPEVVGAYLRNRQPANDPRVLAYQSGLLAILCELDDGTLVDQMPMLSLSKEQIPTNMFGRFTQQIQTINESLFERLLQPVPGHPVQPFTRNSPLRPTDLGRSMAMTGLSIDSVRSLFSKVVDFTQQFGHQIQANPLKDEILSQVLSSIVELKEYTTHELYEPFFGSPEIILAWIRGAEAERLGDAYFHVKLAETLKRKSKSRHPRPIDEEALHEKAFMECMDFFRRLVGQNLSWMAYGFNVLFEYEWERVNGKLTYSPDLAYLPLYIRHGVDTPVAVRLAEAGIRDRRAVRWLDSEYAEATRRQEFPPALLDWLRQLDLREHKMPERVSRVQLQSDLHRIIKRGQMP